MKNNKFNKCIRGLLLILCMALSTSGFVLFTPYSSSAGSERRTVRVGIAETNANMKDNNENPTKAFEEEYIQAIAGYANWNYEYVYIDWADCLEQLKNGGIDILLDVSKTEERLSCYNFSSESMGTEMCFMFGRNGTNLKYNDFASFNGLKVGYENDSTIIDSLREYSQKMGFSVSEVGYPSGDSLLSALDKGEVDAILETSFYYIPSGYVVLAKCDPSPIYIATSKTDPTLISELDDAMSQLLSYNPNFNTDLYQYHFGTTASQTVGFSEKEQAYLSKHPTVNVYYETNWEPFEYEENKEAKGITPDVVRAIGESTGIKFNFVLSSSTQAVYSDINGEHSDAVMAVSCDYSWGDKHDLLMTQPYVSGSVMRVMRDSEFMIPKSVAVVKGGYLANQIRVKHPSLKQIEYLTFEECMKAVADGKADCVFLNSYQASNYRSKSDYEDFVYQPDEKIIQNISLGVTKDSDPALFGILSKSLLSLSSDKLQGILSADSLRPEPLTIKLILRRYPIQIAIISVIFFIVLLLFVILIISTVIRKRQNIQLEAAKSEAEAANKAKSDFLSRMSHDMRTPLNGIIGMTYMTEKMELSEAVHENLRKIDISSKFLLNLINEVLDMSKAESGKTELHPEPYTAKEFFAYIDAVIKPLCEEKDQKLIMDFSGTDNMVPLIDKLHINQIFFNLFSNAVKYTPENGTITFTQKSDIIDENKLRMDFSLSDTGIGMSKEFQKVLFEPFTQENRVDNAEMRGTGLGLTIAKRFVEAMGGTIRVESETGKGTTFFIDMNFNFVKLSDKEPEKTEVGEKTAEDDSVFIGKHILLCEDHPLNQEIAVSLLTEKEMLVEVAEDGQRGVREFEKSGVGYFDCILMDIRMPVMDGYETTEKIRALNRPDAKTVPIIAMTADAFAEDIQKSLNVGMNGHIAKPIDPNVLYWTIRECLDSANKQR